jgi:sialate O-acetylesterase
MTSFGPLLGNHAVLARDEPLKLSGHTRPGAAVQAVLLRIDGAETVFSDATAADRAGNWRIMLPPFSAGGPYRLELIEDGVARTYDDLLFGDLWLAAGQSNMEWSLAESEGGAAHVGGADDPGLRLYRMPRRAAGAPCAEPPAGAAWEVCTPATAGAFSAVAQHFAREYRREFGVPVGLVQAAWGGTPIEAWSAPGSPGTDVPADEPAALEKLLADPEAQAAETRAWEATRDRALADLRGLEAGWARPDFDDSSWARCPVPGFFDEAVGELDGAVWYRLVVDIPAHWAWRELELHLGVIDDLDHTFWNGELVGRTGTDTPEYYRHSRRYRIPASKVRAGRQALAVRVFDEYLAGGFVSRASDLWLAPPAASASERLSLAGFWRVNAEQAITPRRFLPGMPHMLPGVLFNGMIAPVLGTPLRGVLWYQGENNVGYARTYAARFAGLIADWRARWGQPAMPFVFVQLANHGARRELPAGSALAELRAAQAAALGLPATGMATAIDVGDADDIHPRNKHDVGRRLFRAARAVLAGDAAARLGGPVATRAWRAGADGAVRILVSNTQGALRTRDGGVPVGFVVRDADGTLRSAAARLEDDEIVLPGPFAAPVVEVRHAWADNPALNVADALDLPLLPFRLTVER